MIEKRREERREGREQKVESIRIEFFFTRVLSSTRLLLMADDLEELDYGLDSPDPKPARAKGKAGQAGAAPKEEGIGADDIYGDLFAPAAPAVAPGGAGGGAPPPGSIAALEADEVRVRESDATRESGVRAARFFSQPSSFLILSQLRRRAAAQAEALAALQAELESLKAEVRRRKEKEEFLSFHLSPLNLITLHSISHLSHSQRTAWLRERATLLTNMSSLFLTAKAEIARKDVAIKEARAGR